MMTDSVDNKEELAGETAAEPGPGTRQKLLDAARVTLLEKGHIKSTVKEIAATAGVNHGLVHHYFKSKEHLFVELIKENPVFIKDPVNFSSENETIDYLVNHLFANSRLHVQFHALAQDMPEVQAALKEVLQSKKEEVTRMLGISDRNVASLVVAMVSGLVLHYNLDPELPLRENLQTIFHLIKDYRDNLQNQPD